MMKTVKVNLAVLECIQGIIKCMVTRKLFYFVTFYTNSQQMHEMLQRFENVDGV